MTPPTAQFQTPAHPSDSINGVYMMPLRPYQDERGLFMEMFRREWFPWVNWDKLQNNRSDSKAGVLRGLHYHHKQVDYWFALRGVIRVGMADLRPSSPTFRATQVLEIGETNLLGVFIPSGVAHGFVALTDATLLYTVNQYYDGGLDENGVMWNDPDLGVAWNYDSPILSARDLTNPYLRDIPADKLPK